MPSAETLNTTNSPRRLTSRVLLSETAERAILVSEITKQCQAYVATGFKTENRN